MECPLCTPDVTTSSTHSSDNSARGSSGLPLLQRKKVKLSPGCQLLLPFPWIRHCHVLRKGFFSVVWIKSQYTPLPAWLAATPCTGAILGVHAVCSPLARVETPLPATLTTHSGLRLRATASLGLRLRTPTHAPLPSCLLGNVVLCPWEEAGGMVSALAVRAHAG